MGEARERPILMSGPMVVACLEDRKTRTRRALKVQPPAGTVRFDPWLDFDDEWQYERGRPLWASTEADGTRRRYGCPYGKPGDRLWVRETWQDYCPTWDGAWCGCGSEEMIRATHRPVYRADNPDPQPTRWRPAIHMPRWASRITLEITAVRVERLQDISEADALAEGVALAAYDEYATEAFARLWDGINAKRGFGWAMNPYVWVLDFRRVEPAIGGR
jgi:hypothetical protein